jgi:hypothetical protein
MRKDGTWTPGSINGLVQRRLADLQDAVRREGVITTFDQPL